MHQDKNVLGGVLRSCSTYPMTGFYRTGCCETGPDDRGVHVVCTVMTEEFLLFSKLLGNDLSTPRPEVGFEGLKPGYKWCLCLDRWVEALEAGVAPPIVLTATHEAALDKVSLEQLMTHAADLEEE